MRDATLIHLWEARKTLDFPMENVYQFVGISRQAFWQKMAQSRVFAEIERQIVAQVTALRILHPRMGARKIYDKWSCDPAHDALLVSVGRDKFEDILLSNGFRIGKVVAGHRTTFSGEYRFKNLIEGGSFNDINQVWTSDITYYWVENRWVYITLILDLYSRNCLAGVLSERLTTEESSLPALKNALKVRGIKRYDHLIFHSDGGGQYYDKNFVKLSGHHGIKNSMGVSCYENPFSERLNSTIKNEYLIPKKPLTFKALAHELQTTIMLYNTDRPHASINNFTPVDYEKQLKTIPIDKRIPLIIKILQ